MSPFLTDTDILRMDGAEVSKLYLGSALIWKAFLPTDLSGLSIWLDASQLPSVSVGANERILADTAPAATSTGSYNLGTRFVCNADGFITHIRYWHTQACADTHYLAVWDVALGTRVVYISDVPGSATGWREIALVSPFPIKAGRTYIVSYSTTHAWSYTVATPASLAPSLGSATPIYAAYDGIPVNAAGNIYHADCVFQTAPGDVSPWPNLASGGVVGTMVGTPAPRIIPNRLMGKPAVRFVGNLGRLRMTSTGITVDWTLAYVARMLGPLTDRVVSSTTPPGPGHLLVGYHGGKMDSLHDNGWASPNPEVNYTSAWKLYSADGSGSLARIFSNGTYLTSTPAALGWGGTFGISGFDPTTTVQTSDCEVAEVIFYNRKLSDVERQKVELYLRRKWGF